MFGGDVFVANIPSHGMEADNNLVKIKGVLPDTIGSPLTQTLDISSSVMVVQDDSEFAAFEGITTSIGYAYVGNEIVEYSYSGGGTIGITSRGVDNTIISIHDAGTKVYKYEMSGVSLRRINKEHQVPVDSTLGNTREIDNLPLQISRNPRPLGPDQLNFNQEQSAGGNRAFSSVNYQYSRAFPNMSFHYS